MSGRTPSAELDIASNRAARKWTRRELAGRVLWAVVQPAFRLSPRPLWAWRRALLRLFGAKIGQEVRIDPSARIFIPWNLSVGDWTAIGWDAVVYDLGPVTIGRRATISQRAHLCAGTHDHTRADMPLLKSPITVGDDAWICADAFVGPGVNVGAGAVVGARAVALRSIEPLSVVHGNPARKVKTRNL